MEVKFLRGKFAKTWDKKVTVWENARDTLVSVDDIKRVKACKVHIHNPVTKKDIGTRMSFVITTINRISSDLNDDEITIYEITDPVETLAAAINRDPEELNAMLLELELNAN